MATVTPQPVPTPHRPDAGADAAVRAALAAITRLLAETPGQPIPAVIGTTLPNGLTQVLAASRQFTLQLPTPLPPGLAVTLATSMGPQGQQLQIRPQLSSSSATPTPPVPASLLQSPNLPQAVAQTAGRQPTTTPGSTDPRPPAPSSITALQPTGTAPVSAHQPAGTQSQQAPVDGYPSAPPPQPAPVAERPAASANAPPVGREADRVRQPAGPAIVAMISTAAATAAPASASATSVMAYRALQPGASTPSPPSHAAPSSAPDSSDPVSLALRQQNAAPLLARLVAVIARPDLPPDVRQAALKVLAARVSLDALPPDGAALRNAIAAASPQPGQKNPASGLLELRQALGRLIVGGVEMRHANPDRMAPPLRGDAPRAAPASSPLSAEGDRQELVQQLAAQADGAIARHRLLQLAAQPADARGPSGPELRVEVPMMLAGETGMVQFVIERDARRSRSKRERGWRMRFALNFSALGEVGADVSLMGRRASVAMWADSAETAAALAALADDLAPALARHGLDLGSFELRRGPRPTTPATPGQLLDRPR